MIGDEFWIEYYRKNIEVLQSLSKKRLRHEIKTNLVCPKKKNNKKQKKFVVITIKTRWV